MIVDRNHNLSKLAELMGNGYTDVDASNFATWLIEEQGITNTNQIEDFEWPDMVIMWEVHMNISFA